MPTDLPPTPEKNAAEPPDQSDMPARRAPGPGARDESGAFRIATLAGIPIRVHWSFFALLVWIAIMGVSGRDGNADTRSALGNVVFVVALFGCVVLHELGHALVALQYGIRTRDIVLYPIGGLARLQNLPRPREELWIAVAGPAVNVVIAAILALGLRATGYAISPSPMNVPSSNLVNELMWANIALVGFNMLPAFPMDGGRVVRAILARFTSESNATAIAARIGQFMAIIMGLVGLFGPFRGGFMLVIIAFFIYVGAQQEAAAFQTRVLTEGRRVREAMLHEFRTLTVGTTLREAADTLLAGSQHDFPVVHGGEVVGVLSRSALLRGMATEGPDSYVAGVMDRDFVRARPDDSLETILTQMAALQNGPILVMEGDGSDLANLAGMITQENLLEFLMLTQIRAAHSPELPH